MTNSRVVSANFGTVGALRDLTGSVASGFYAVALADLLTLALIVTVYRTAWNRQHVTVDTQ